MNYLCTFFDRRYLSRGMALHRSLAEQRSGFFLWVLCMDRETRDVLSVAHLKNVGLLSIEDLGRHDDMLYQVKENRSLVEFYFTSKSFLCQYILDAHPEVDLLTYVDADAFFFGDPAAIRTEMNDYSVGLTPHRFQRHIKDRARFGTFNAGFLCFRSDEIGRKCLAWWRDNCIAWCHDYVDNGRFADQGYLDLIPERFDRVKCIEHRGINLAPWNIAECSISQTGGVVHACDEPLILYHFHGLKKKRNNFYDSGLSSFHTSLSGAAKRYIYLPYLDTLRNAEAKVPMQTEKKGIRIEKKNDANTRTTEIVSVLIAYWMKAVNIGRGIYYHSFIWHKAKS